MVYVCTKNTAVISDIDFARSELSTVVLNHISVFLLTRSAE